jgi:hypothetical protein
MRAPPRSLPRLLPRSPCELASATLPHRTIAANYRTIVMRIVEQDRGFSFTRTYLPVLVATKRIPYPNRRHVLSDHDIIVPFGGITIPGIAAFGWPIFATGPRTLQTAASDVPNRLAR